MVILGALMIFWGIFGSSQCSQRYFQTNDALWLMLMVLCMFIAPMGVFVMAAGQ